MKFTYHTYLLFTALISGTILAQPVDSDTDASEGIDATSVTHTENGPPSIGGVADANARSALAKKCITFTSANPNWHYRASGPWASIGTGKFGRGAKKLCFPTTGPQGAGGALFIGPEANPQGGNTILECFLPHSGNGNCDMSLVDGYSLSVSCDIDGGHKVGGDTNLWKTGKPCPDVDAGRGICVNHNGAQPHKQSDVAPFFREGNRNGNFYCTFWECKQDYSFNVNKEIKCHISGGRN